MPTLPAQENGIIAAPHIVVLGAGASIAAYNDWGKIGNTLPAMQDLVDILELKEDLTKAGFDPNRTNFEDFYDQIATTNGNETLREAIETRVYEYFSNLSLPDNPTIYDYLILALREKDVIATFNWDPFLLKAYLRNEIVSKTRRPQLAFLHGNVLVGVCEDHLIKGINGHTCGVCKKLLTPSKLLYPVRQKNYTADRLIKNEWSVLKEKLSYGYYLTIFGYSAPKTDIEARELMLDDWKKNPTLELAEVDIVDIQSKADLEKNWEEFFVSHHYNIVDDIFKSYLFMYPRRSCDAFSAATLMLAPWHDNPFPKFATLEELQTWVGPLIEEEEKNSKEKIPFTGNPTPPNNKARPV